MKLTTDLKGELLTALRGSRAVMLAKLDGLSEYDRRRPLTPSGTNLLGLVKHLAGLEYGYLGASFGRPPLERPSWFRDDPYSEIDMWATPDESSDYITAVYQRACAHSDVTIDGCELDSPGRVAHWAEGQQETTLGVLLIRMVGETAQHAGHADIIRELIDGRITDDEEPIASESTFWRDRRRHVQEAADWFHAAGADAQSAGQSAGRSAGGWPPGSERR
ncbi:DinB family protein [Micromonospora sp. CPCC 206061]|uniref:DinB family protein n=1 Tax=Micromonospora sp. CPCC 206061 TaxID=3122410 RepID=UPI002FEF63E4